MSNLEIYIVKKYGEFVPFDICSRELNFDVVKAVALTIKKSGDIKIVNNDGLVPKLKNKPYEYLVPVMSMCAVRGDSLRYIEFARLLDLNMHLGVDDD